MEYQDILVLIKLVLIELNQLFKLMKFRGPDKQKYIFRKINNKNIYFLHSRLSIIDLNKRSDQPFIMNDLALIFNGEIYNYIELKEEFSKVTFTTNSDTRSSSSLL